jgi:CopG family nickel-responsive transcriptional regulator
MREHLVQGEWDDDDAQVMGTITLVYNHEKPDLTKVLTRVQHESHDAIVCSTHVHLDEHNCMEVVVVRGMVAEIRGIANALIAAKGVKHGRLVSTSAGKDLP